MIFFIIFEHLCSIYLKLNLTQAIAIFCIVAAKLYGCMVSYFYISLRVYHNDTSLSSREFWTTDLHSHFSIDLHSVGWLLPQGFVPNWSKSHQKSHLLLDSCLQACQQHTQCKSLEPEARNRHAEIKLWSDRGDAPCVCSVSWDYKIPITILSKIFCIISFKVKDGLYTIRVKTQLWSHVLLQLMPVN